MLLQIVLRKLLQIYGPYWESTRRLAPKIADKTLSSRQKVTLLFFYVTVIFDDGLEAFEAARKEKMDKYKNLAEQHSNNDKTAVV